jgi:hypothetical protein
MHEDLGVCTTQNFVQRGQSCIITYLEVLLISEDGRTCMSVGVLSSCLQF